MCGLCGVLSRGAPPNATDVTAMTNALIHRGPDGEGQYREGPVALGHRRLSIIDLSDAAAEPMSNEDGTVWLTFNGEIYNFQELRKTLKPHHRLRSDGDAEVLLHLYEDQGDSMVRHLEGMFAFAIWDTRKQRLLIARDRAGKKPLYYYDSPGLFAFASEPKALFAYPGVPRQIDRSALPLYLTYGYVPTPRTFYRSIVQLPPGHFMWASKGQTSPPQRYWQVRFESGPSLNESDAAEELRHLLRQAVKRRLVADVPLGAFLSGGLDSSAVVAFMCEAAGSRVRTFSIGFAGSKDYDETSHARLIANRFGTDHTEFIVEPQALDLLDRLVWHHDAPFGDSSAVPTYLLSELTKRQVTVALNGDGGDEIFAGYLRFYGGWLSESVPRPLFHLAHALLSFLPEPLDRKSRLRLVKRFLEAGRLPLVERYLRWNSFFSTDVSRLLRPEMRASYDPSTIADSFRDEFAKTKGVLPQLLQINFGTYLLDDLLVKMDRMSMAHGLEARSPFLDREVIEFGARLPDRLRFRRGTGKWIVRRAMKGLLPESTLTRAKMGFGAPLGSWFRVDQQEWVRERLLASTSPLYEFLEPGPVKALVETHMSSSADFGQQIWSLLTLESWLRQQTTASAS